MKYFAALFCLLTLTQPAFAATRICRVEGPETGNCRETITTLITGEHRQEAKGVACLQPTASWLVVSGPGYGMSFNGRDTTTTYLGSGTLINNIYQAPPEKIRFVVTDASVCVPALPADLQRTKVIVPPAQIIYRSSDQQ